MSTDLRVLVLAYKVSKEALDVAQNKLKEAQGTYEEEAKGDFGPQGLNTLNHIEVMKCTSAVMDASIKFNRAQMFLVLAVVQALPNTEYLKEAREALGM